MNSSTKKIRLLVDGMFFQFTNSGIARVWKSILEIIAIQKEIDIFFLDRGNAPDIHGITYIPFPDSQSVFDSADSKLIQQICDHYQIDVFTSTYYSVPLSTPMLLMVYDMIPELFDYDLSHRIWIEKQTAISYGQRYLCISNCTKNDLLLFYPEIPPEMVSVAHCGVDGEVFYPRSENEIHGFRKKYELDRPYFIFVGSRVQHNGYKNSRLFFDALEDIENTEFDVFCVGGEEDIESEVLSSLPIGVRAYRVKLSDDELSIAYGGAIALVYPSLYEGFGMPVIEAMASACPVITTHNGSLVEAAGEAARLISGISKVEMVDALVEIQMPEYRNTLIEKGLAHAVSFQWENMASLFVTTIGNLLKEHQAQTYDKFLKEWEQLRKIQITVDF